MSNYYEIEYGPVGGPYQTAQTGDVTQFLQDNLEANTQYEARVRRIEGADTSHWSDFVQVWTLEDEIFTGISSLVAVVSEAGILVQNKQAVFEGVESNCAVTADTGTLVTNESFIVTGVSSESEVLASVGTATIIQSTETQSRIYTGAASQCAVPATVGTATIIQSTVTRERIYDGVSALVEVQSSVGSPVVEKRIVEVYVLSASNLTINSARLNAELVSLGEEISVDVHFEYRAVGEASWNTTTVQTLSSLQTFYADISLLSSDTEYEFRVVCEYGITTKYTIIEYFWTLKDGEYYTVTFDVEDSLYNKVGVNALLEAFSNEQFQKGELNNVITYNDKLQLKQGFCLTFNGSNRVETPWNPNLTDLGISGEGTLEYWAYFTSSTVDQFIGAFGRLADPLSGDPETDPLYSRFYLGRQHTGVLRMGYGDDWRNLYDSSIPINQWVHLAMTNDGETTTGYVNGTAIGTNPSSFDRDNTVHAFHIGECNGAYAETNGPVNRPVHGHIDEVRVWNTCRTAQQILDNKDIKVDPATANLIRYWRLDDGIGLSGECSVDDAYTGTLLPVENPPTWNYNGKLGYGEISGEYVSQPIQLSLFSNDLRIHWSTTQPANTAVTVQVAFTDDFDEAPSGESKWATVTNGETLELYPEYLYYAKYLWARVKLETTVDRATPLFDWIVIHDNENEPYAFAYINFDGRIQVTNVNGITHFTNFSPLSAHNYTAYIYPLNTEYHFPITTITGNLDTVSGEVTVDVLAEVNSFRFTHQYVESAVFPTEFPVRFTHQYIEKAAVIYTYIPDLPPFDWYPCFRSTSNWSSWLIKEYIGALEDQVLRFLPPGTTNYRQGMFWLGKNAKDAILEVSAKVDRVRTDQTSAGVPPADAVPYSPVLITRSQPTSPNWTTGVHENVAVVSNTVQLIAEQVEGHYIAPELSLDTGYILLGGEQFPNIIGDSKIEWTSDEPQGTELIVEIIIRISGEDGAGIEDDEWTQVENGGVIPGVEMGDFYDGNSLLVRTRFTTEDINITPVLQTMTITVYGPEESGIYVPPAGTQYFGVFSRGSGLSHATTTCYLLSCTITADGNRRRQLELGKYTNGSYFLLQAIYYEWEIDVFYRLKLMSINDWLYGKIWKYGDPEPAEYQLQIRDSEEYTSGTATLESGFSGVFCLQASNTSGGVPLYSFDAFHFTPITPVPRLNDSLTVEVLSVRDGYESWQAQRHTLECWGYGTYYGERYGD